MSGDRHVSSEVRKKTFRGATFNFVCEPGNHASWWSFEDEDVVRERWWWITPGDVVLDCGAAFGSYGLPALALGASKLVAWTPEGHMPLFQASVNANVGWKDKVIAFDSGLWSEPGWLQAVEHGGLPVFHSELPIGWKETMPPNAFSVMTVDAMLAPLPEIVRVDWMKLDVEGAELEVLKGARETIKTYKPRIMCENHLFKDPEMQRKCATLIASLDVGYREIGTVPYHSVSHSLYSL